MIGLIVLFVMGVYLAVFILVIIWAARFAKRKGRSPWLGGILGALFMYLIVFWDHIPTEIMYRHYCNKEAGVWIYKTVEQWKRENPGVAETLGPYDESKFLKDVQTSISAGDPLNDYTTKLQLNKRFIEVRNKKGPMLINVFKRSHKIVDVKTGEVMARWIDFSSGYGSNPVELGTEYGLKGFKVWLADDECSCYSETHSTYSCFRNSIQKIGGK